MLGEESKIRANPQNNGEEGRELARETQQQVLALHLLKMVGTELGQPACRFAGAEAAS